MQVTHRLIDDLLAKGPQTDINQLIGIRHLASQVNLFNRNRSRSIQSGGHRSLFRGRGMEFDEVRVYQAGDDIRSIDWRVTARSSRPHTKVFKEEKERPVLLAVDQRPPMFFGSRVTYKSVMAAQTAALLAWSGLSHNDKVGGIVFNESEHKEVKPRRSKHAVLQLIQTLSAFNQMLFDQQTSASNFTFTDMLERLRHIAKPGSAIFLLSDFHDFDDNAARLLHLIRRHTDIYALVVADPMEESLPNQGVLSFTDGNSRVSLNTGKHSTREHYQQHFKNHQESLKQAFDQLAIPHRLLWTTDNPWQTLKSLFPY